MSITSIIQKVALQIGAVVLLEPEYKLVGHITFKNGKRSVFSYAKLNINGLASAESKIKPIVIFSSSSLDIE